MSGDRVNIEQALEKIGVSYFQMRLFFILGLSFMADAMEVTLLSFIAVCAADDFNLSNFEEAFLASMVFAGELGGGIFWGPIADKFGRRPTFIVSALLIAVAGLASGVSPNYEFLVAMRFLVGFGIGGSYIPFDLHAEMLPSSERGEYLIIINYFWTVGSVFVVLVAWAVIESDGWRTLTMITAVPVFVAFILAYFYLPESPRWLMIHDRIQEAEEIINHGAVLNGYATLDSAGTGDRGVSMQEVRKNPVHQTKASSGLGSLGTSLLDEQYVGGSPGHGSADEELPVEAGAMSPLTFTTPAGIPHTFQLVLSDEEKALAKAEANGNIWSLTYETVATAAMRQITVPLAILWLLGAGVGYFGVVLFVTRLYTDDDNDDDGGSCAFQYVPILESCFSEVVGILLASLCINRIGRVNLQVGCYSIAAACILALGFSLNGDTEVTFVFLARGAAMGGICTTWVITPELFPTNLRATGHAVCYSFARVGAFAAAYLIESNASIQTCAIGLAVANIIAAVIAWQLPETTGKLLNVTNPVVKEIDI